MSSNDDLNFIGGNFFEFDLPKDKLYLFNYFTTDIEKQFLRYYYCFGNYEYFNDHTGIFCQKRWLKILLKRHDKIVNFHQKVKKDIDIELLARIESGICKIEEMSL